MEIPDKKPWFRLGGVWYERGMGLVVMICIYTYMYKRNNTNTDNNNNNNNSSSNNNNNEIAIIMITVVVVVVVTDNNNEKAIVMIIPKMFLGFVPAPSRLCSPPPPRGVVARRAAHGRRQIAAHGLCRQRTQRSAQLRTEQFL